MGQILTILGRGGSGKSTLATNLACGFASKNKVVILMACDINCPNLQNFFEETVPDDLGTIAALEDRAEQPDKFLIQSKKNENIYILSAPNTREAIYNQLVPLQRAATMIRRLAAKADYLIVDTANDLFNGLTNIGVAKADALLYAMKSTVADAMWYKSHRTLYLDMCDKGTGANKVYVHHFITAHDSGCNIGRFEDLLKLRNVTILPDVIRAEIYETVGTPLYFEKGERSAFSKKDPTNITAYNAQINQFTDDMILERM